jgi:hypothetical protein
VSHHGVFSCFWYGEEVEVKPIEVRDWPLQEKAGSWGAYLLICGTTEKYAVVPLRRYKYFP